jgi:ABC-type sugar transport system ATPase subunit
MVCTFLTNEALVAMSRCVTDKSSVQEMKTTTIYVRFEVFTAMTMQETVFWDLAIHLP